MTDILIRPLELRQISEQLRASAKKIGAALQAIDHDILSLKGDKFLGNRANAVQAHYAPKREALLKAKEIVAHFAEDLQNIAAAFERADRSGQGGSFLPDSGGAIWGNRRFPSLPIFHPDILNLRIMPLPIHLIDTIRSIPKWLQDKLGEVFKPAEVISPLGKEQASSVAASAAQGGMRNSQPAVQGALAGAQTGASPAHEQVAAQGGVDVRGGVANPANAVAASVRSAVDISFNVPAKSQGELYGNAACSPTSVSMVLDYYSAQNAQNRTASPQEIIAMMDKGDGTYGKGMSLSNLTDELNDLGYKNVTQQVGAQYADLRAAVKDGPVIVTSGVKIVGPGTVTANVARAIDGPGNTIHAMVVTGVGDDQVNINDPWSGQQMQLPRDTFEKMWSRGSSAVYSIRP
jgi:predicted double-glycine peptidase/uncharacterized protein YukE